MLPQRVLGFRAGCIYQLHPKTKLITLIYVAIVHCFLALFFFSFRWWCGCGMRRRACCYCCLAFGSADFIVPNVCLSVCLSKYISYVHAIFLFVCALFRSLSLSLTLRSLAPSPSLLFFCSLDLFLRANVKRADLRSRGEDRRECRHFWGHDKSSQHNNNNNNNNRTHVRRRIA